MHGRGGTGGQNTGDTGMFDDGTTIHKDNLLRLTAGGRQSTLPAMTRATPR
jgi:hypothetical protein